jgi:hypothetical protein
VLAGCQGEAGEELGKRSAYIAAAVCTQIVTTYLKTSRSQRSQLSFAPVTYLLFHHAASKRIVRATFSAEASPTPLLLLSVAGQDSHELPEGDYSVIGVPFEVDFKHVHHHNGHLHAAHLLYQVRHKSQLKGKREAAPIWKYGVELSYLENDLITYSKLWLCWQCYLSWQLNDAKMVNGTAHIVEHLKKVYKIDPATGLLPMTLAKPSSLWEVAAKVAESGSLVAHALWQEEAFQAALVNLVIVKDVSFRVAVSPEMRALLTWNWAPLLAALPNSHNTLTSYVVQSMRKRKVEVAAMLQAAWSQISVSVDIWTSSNHLSFLGVVAHFVGKFFRVSDFPTLSAQESIR